jgi:hypothetical protein
MLFLWIVKQNNSHGCAIQSVRPFIHNIQHTNHPSYHFSFNHESQSATLSITLFVIEEGEQSGEGVGEGERAVVVFEDLKHFKTLVVICRAGILKEETGVPAVFRRCPDLALPELAGKGIHQVSDEC